MSLPALVRPAQAAAAMAAAGGPPLVALDCSWYLDGSQPAKDGPHLPGAQFFDIDAVADGSSGLPHMLPSAEVFAEAVGGMGIGSDTHVLVYAQAGSFAAPRLWWTFHAFGHPHVSVLQGGLPAWLATAGCPVEEGPFLPPADGPRDFSAALRPELVRSAAQVLDAVVDRQAARLFDARPAARFRGEAPEPRAGVRGGHVPGAESVPFLDLLEPDDVNSLRSLEELRAALPELPAADGDEVIVTSCGSGVTACTLSLAMHLLGLPLERVPVYDGSWTEWGSSPELPVVL